MNKGDENDYEEGIDFGPTFNLIVVFYFFGFIFYSSIGFLVYYIISILLHK